jgi:predicted membrane protein
LYLLYLVCNLLILKKLTLLSFIILFAAYSCSPTINRPLYTKSDNAKELILSKYGKPSKVEHQVEKEKWIYNHNSQFKSNRTVVFDNCDKIITNKKHYKAFHMHAGFNKYGYISGGIILVFAIIFGPFPALL